MQGHERRLIPNQFEVGSPTMSTCIEGRKGESIRRQTGVSSLGQQRGSSSVLKTDQRYTIVREDSFS